MNKKEGVKLSAKYPSEIKCKAIELAKEGHNDAEIGRILNIPPSTIREWRKAAGIQPSKIGKYPQKIKDEALNQMKEGKTNAEISRSLGIHPRTIGGWRKASGFPSLKAAQYTTEQFNHVIDLIREGNTLAQIHKKTGVGRRKIKQWREEEVRDGNPLPELKKGVARNQKYSDEELIELAFLNPGFGFQRFVQSLGVTESFVFQLFDEFKKFTQGNLDPYATLQDPDFGQMVTRSEYLEITGRKYLPQGSGKATGGMKSPGTNAKSVYLPPQIFNWGDIDRKE